MKKVVTVLLLAALILSLCACGGNPNQTQAVTETTQAKPNTEEKQEKEKETMQDQPETFENDTVEEADENGIRPQIKEAIDSYEAFVDEYYTFMTEYSLTDISKLSTYNELLSKELEMTKKFEALENEELNEAEALYYSEVSLRCSQKMLEIAGKILK